MLKSNMKIVSLLDDDEQNIKEGEIYIIKSVEEDYVITTDNKKFSLMFETFEVVDQISMIRQSANQAKKTVREDIKRLKRTSRKN